MAQNDGVVDPRLTEDIWESKAMPVIIGVPDPANPGKSSPVSVGNPLSVTVTNPTGAADVSALSKETTQLLIKNLLAGTLSVNTGTTERRAVISQQTLDLSAGTAVSLPAAPNGATSLQIQPQGADVRLNVAGGTPTALSGLLFGQDGIYDLYVLTNVRIITTAPAAAGLQAELIWRA